MDIFYLFSSFEWIVLASLSLFVALKFYRYYRRKFLLGWVINMKRICTEASLFMLREANQDFGEDLEGIFSDLNEIQYYLQQGGLVRFSLSLTFLRDTYNCVQYFIVRKSKEVQI